MTAVVGICERRSGTTGTLYNSQVHVAGDGTIRCIHQKFVPTIGERLVHAPGTTGHDNTSTWAAGAVTSLICGENSHPMARYLSARSYPTVHVAAWPQHCSPERAMREVIRLVSRGRAYSLRTYVLNAVTMISPDMIEAYGYSGAEAYLRDPPRPGAPPVA